MGVCGVGTHTKGRFRLVGYIGGRVVTEADHSQYIGATTVGSFAVEASALAWAYSWAAQPTRHAKTTLHYDSEPPAQSAQSEWAYKSNRTVIAIARATTSLIRTSNELEFAHVKGAQWTPLE